MASLTKKNSPPFAPSEDNLQIIYLEKKKKYLCLTTFEKLDICLENSMYVSKNSASISKNSTYVSKESTYVTKPSTPNPNRTLCLTGRKSPTSSPNQDNLEIIYLERKTQYMCRKEKLDICVSKKGSIYVSERKTEYVKEKNTQYMCIQPPTLRGRCSVQKGRPPPPRPATTTCKSYTWRGKINTCISIYVKKSIYISNLNSFVEISIHVSKNSISVSRKSTYMCRKNQSMWLNPKPQTLTGRRR